GVAVAVFVLALGFGATAVVIVALLLGLGAALWQARTAREQARAARIEGRKAQAVKRFLLDIFEANSHMQDDPLKAQQTTARELLDIGVQRVEEGLRDEPEARLEVLESLAEIYLQIGLRLEAARLYQMATDLARAAYGPQDLRFARVALHCARALNSTPLRDEVPRLLDEARLALDAGRDDPDLRAHLLHDLTTHYRYQSLAKALPASEEAASLVERIDLEEAPNLYRVAARMQMIAGHYDRAEQFLRQAISAAQKQGDARTVNAHTELAEALHHQGRVTEAEAHARQALALSEHHHGPQHRWTLIVRVRLSNLLFEAGRGDEAAALRDQCERALAQDRPEYDAMFRADMADYLARPLSSRGRPDLSEPLERADLADLEQHFPHSSARAQREAELADIALGYGRLDDAKSLIDAAIARWDRFLGGHGTPAVTVHCKSVAARLHMANGRLDAAASCLAGADWPTRAGVGRFRAAVLKGVAQRAEIETRLGRPGRAQALADAELAALHEHLQGAQLPDPTALLLLARGNARRATEDLRGAESDLRAALELRRMHDDNASLWLAEVEVALASCLMVMDGRDEARTLLADAQNIYRQHPGPSPRFLLPLEQAMAEIRS
ncbi:MAG: tetratricopeptide repeat protein, partial [Burkholderiaceae bacterium]